MSIWILVFWANRSNPDLILTDILDLVCQTSRMLHFLSFILSELVSLISITFPVFLLTTHKLRKISWVFVLHWCQGIDLR